MQSKTLPLLVLGVALVGGGLFLASRNQAPAEAPLAPEGLSPGSDAASGADDTTLASALEGRTEGTRQEVATVSATKERRAEEAAAEAEDGAAAGPFLQGTVFGSDGMPLGGVEVRIEGNLGEGFMGLGKIALNQVGKTDRNGDFSVPRGRWPANDVSVSLETRGYLASRENRMPESSSGNAHLGTFLLQRGVVLAGNVYDAKGEPVEGARVHRTSLEDTGAMDGMIALATTFGQWKDSADTTDSEGAFELPNEEPGPYALIVEHDHYPKARIEGQTPPEGGEDLTITIRLAPTANISGRILGYPGSERNATVSATPVRKAGTESAPIEKIFGGAMSNDGKVQVGEDGSFVVTGLEVGCNYHVQAFVKDGFFARTPCSQREEVGSGSTDVELEWDWGAKIVFELEEAATGKPLRGSTVRYRWEQNARNVMAMARKAREFAGSRIVIDELRPSPSPSKLELAIFADGYLEHRVSGIEVHESKEIDLGIIRLRPSPILRVRVVDASSGKPLRKARVVLQPQYEGEGDNFFSLGGKVQTGRTDSEGLCELPAAATPTATLTVNKGGFAPTVFEDLAMPAEGTTEELVHLAKGGAVHITVLESDGTPATNALITHRDNNGDRQTLSSNARGEAHIRDLPAGEHAFAADRGSEGQRGGRGGRGRRGGVRVSNGNDDEDGRRWEEAMVTSGSRVELRLDLPPTARVEGVVRLRGEPVAQASISLFEGDEGSSEDEFRARISERVSSFMPNAPASTRTDTEGRFVIEDVETGKYRIRVGRAGGVPSHYEPLDVTLGTNRIEVSLPGAAVEGRVMSDDGGPIAGATVEVLRFDPKDPDAGPSAEQDLALSFFGGQSRDSIRTDVDGNFLVEGAPTGVSIVVEARAPGYVTKRSKEFEIAVDSLERNVKVKLTRGGSIRVQVEGGSGLFQSVKAEFEGDSKGAPSSRMTFISEGSALLRDLTPGTWRVSIRGEEETELVEVLPGAESFVTLIR
jgi:protocatechuate 3,4-dioxygenase beta subunit